MQTRISTKGQVVLPEPIRRKLGIRAGDALEISIEDGRVVLSPHPRQHLEFTICTDPLTGLPVISAGKDAPLLTSEQVSQILSEFP